jgi:hypothetical protein
VSDSEADRRTDDQGVRWAIVVATGGLPAEAWAPTLADARAQEGFCGRVLVVGPEADGVDVVATTPDACALRAALAALPDAEGLLWMPAPARSPPGRARAQLQALVGGAAACVAMAEPEKVGPVPIAAGSFDRRGFAARAALLRAADRPDLAEGLIELAALRAATEGQLVAVPVDRAVAAGSPPPREAATLPTPADEAAAARALLARTEAFFGAAALPPGPGQGTSINAALRGLMNGLESWLDTRHALFLALGSPQWRTPASEKHNDAAPGVDADDDLQPRGLGDAGAGGRELAGLARPGDRGLR